VVQSLGVDVGGDEKDNVVLAAEVFAEHGDYIKAIIRSLIRDTALVDDIFQDFFLCLVARPIPPDVRNIRSYIYRALARDSFDAIRRIEQYRGRLVRYSQRNENIINIDDRENALIETEETEKMLRTIRGLLPQSESTAVALRFVNGSTIGQIAEQMAVDKRSVSRYISVGLKKLRKFLAKKEAT